MADTKGIKLCTTPQNQSATYVNATYGTSSDVDLAPEEAAGVYESLRIPGPTDNADDPNTRITQPPKTKVNRRLQIALVLMGIICAALIAIVVWSLSFTQKENSDKLNHESESLVSANNGSNVTNHCQSKPCRNGATCENYVSSFRCSCSSGYQGTWCESVTNHCLSQPCKNGASCVDLVGSFRCSCTLGFQGARCEADVNECLNNPCASGATCRNSYGGFHCSCPRGFTGTLCQLEISECSSRPCQNGGTCVDMVNSYRCLCSAGYYGTNCQVKDFCRRRPCQNGAMCRSQNSTYSCSCSSGYTGRNCEIGIESPVDLVQSPYRLRGFKFNGNYAGRVEIYHGSTWGTICDDYWDNKDAKVFCKSLNLPYSNALALQSAAFGQGTGQIWLDDVNCTGSENSIEYCSHNSRGTHNCQHSEDAGVICL